MVGKYFLSPLWPEYLPTTGGYWSRQYWITRDFSSYSILSFEKLLQFLSKLDDEWWMYFWGKYVVYSGIHANTHTKKKDKTQKVTENPHKQKKHTENTGTHTWVWIMIECFKFLLTKVSINRYHSHLALSLTLSVSSHDSVLILMVVLNSILCKSVTNLLREEKTEVT